MRVSRLPRLLFAMCNARKSRIPSIIISKICVARLSEVITPIHRRMLPQSNAVEVESMIEMLNWFERE